MINPLTYIRLWLQIHRDACNYGLPCIHRIHTVSFRIFSEYAQFDSGTIHYIDNDYSFLSISAFERNQQLRGFQLLHFHISAEFYSDYLDTTVLLSPKRLTSRCQGQLRGGLQDDVHISGVA
jgi:hypothetical protein